MSERVLLVDDEQSILDGFRRNLRRRFDIETASSPAAALALIESGGPFAAVVSDLQMPEMDGIEFLIRVRDIAPDTVRMMLTGQADLNVSIEAVNTGNVFRFLTKPCDADNLAAALTAAIEQYRLVRAERELLENTLQGAVEMLTDVLSMLDPGSQALAGLVQARIEQMCRALGVSDWQIELAAMLSQLGNITLPTETAAKLEQGGLLTTDEKAMVAGAPAAASRLLAHVPRLEGVAQMIADQDAPPPCTANFDSDAELVAAGSNMLHIAIAFERLLASGRTKDDSIEALRRSVATDFQLSLVTVLAGDTVEPEWHEEALPLSAIEPDMVLAENLVAVNGVLLLGKDVVMSRARLERLRIFAAGVGVSEPIRVLVPVLPAQPERVSIDA